MEPAQEKKFKLERDVKEADIYIHRTGIVAAYFILFFYICRDLGQSGRLQFTWDWKGSDWYC